MAPSRRYQTGALQRHQQRLSKIISSINASLICQLVMASCAMAIQPNVSDLDQRYRDSGRQFIGKYCAECHSPELAEADIDLVRFESLSDVRSDVAIWLKVAEILDSQQMPPKDAPQPKEAERVEFRSWLSDLLTQEAKRTAGDPGPVVLRRLNNAQYNFVIQDLTDVASLFPSREFPADGAAGEGFTNAGNAMSMSPSLLTKYFDAAKEVAAHAVLTPDGIYFSPSTTRRDWTEEILNQIRQLYSKYTAKDGGTQVNLQGIVFNTNGGGRLPVEQYLLATIEERQRFTKDLSEIESVAQQRGLSAKYLRTLWQSLNSGQLARSSILLSELQQRWRVATPDDVPEMVGFISRWQQSLWRFASVGHIGKVNGPKAWLEPNNPIVDRQEIRYKIPAIDGPEAQLFLVTSDAGDGQENDFAVWENPRLVAPGRPDLPLRDLRRVANALAEQRELIFQEAEKCLNIASDAIGENHPISIEELAKQSNVSRVSLQAWFDYLGIGMQGRVKIPSLIKDQATSLAGYDFVKGWVGPDALSVVANSSDQNVRVPGNMSAHSVAVHPTPTLQVAVGWLSPVSTTIRIEGSVQHAHPECGNGVAWSLELRRGNGRQKLAVGHSQGGAPVGIGPITDLAVQAGDLVSLLIAPRDGNHSCDLTAIDFKLSDRQREWNLAKDVSNDILVGNPHADGFGNAQVWHFYSEPVQSSSQHMIPTGSLLARWQSSGDRSERSQLAKQLSQWLMSNSTAPTDKADLEMLGQLRSMSGPLLAAVIQNITTANPTLSKPSVDYGLDLSAFGHHPNGDAIEPNSICIQAPSVIEIKLPADLAVGAELVATGVLHTSARGQGSVQFDVRSQKPETPTGRNAIQVSEQIRNGVWTSNNRSLSLSSPIVAAIDSQAHRQLVEDFDAFRRLFPAALCYSKIVPVDEVVTLTLFHREDHHLIRLMLSDAESAKLESLWQDMHFVSQDAFMLVDAFEQLWQYATQDADPSAFEPLREPIKQRAAEFRDELVRAEPKHLQSTMKFAERAFRRPISVQEQRVLEELYRQLRIDELNHDAAIRMLIARILMSPAFLYRAEAGTDPIQHLDTIPVRRLSDLELASRLSFFLWSSTPDQLLIELASSGQLQDPKVRRMQIQRMIADQRIERLSTEFFAQWLHVYEFDTHDEKSESTFPGFIHLRGAMYEEVIHFCTDLVRRNGSALELIDSDHTFVNADLAKHYGLVDNSAEFHRVDGMRKLGRGGIFGMAATMSKQAGASRTSPILRGNWISEVLMGEKLPKPPKSVPQLPEAVPIGLTERQLIEMHSSDPACAKCHARIDPFGFALENFDAIGGYRSGPEINVQTNLTDGTRLDGLPGLKQHLLTTKRDAFVRQMCKKLLGFALGRSVQLSDEPLLEQMRHQLAQNEFRIQPLIETIVESPQFQSVRSE